MNIIDTIKAITASIIMLKVGIVGLANVGKATLFNTLLKKQL